MTKEIDRALRLGKSRPGDPAQATDSPTEVDDLLREHSDRFELADHVKATRNWGRWGWDDQIGALNLITPDVRMAAARLVQSGRNVSLGRPLRMDVAADNPKPTLHAMTRFARDGRVGGCRDYYGVWSHGVATTHLDALCHIWDADGMWNGRDPDAEIAMDGARWGSIDHWRHGVLTRGVLLDVPRHRGDAFVRAERPVTGAELTEIARAEGVEPRPGDALVLYCGREDWDREMGSWGAATVRPGSDASCLPILRRWDCALLVWDMLETDPDPSPVAFSVHAALYAYGIGLVDNALLKPLAEACAEEGRYEFALFMSPLIVVGGTASPINPIAIF